MGKIAIQRIYQPNRIKNLEQYCDGSRGIIDPCYEYGKPDCPKTCQYATMQKASRIAELRRLTH